MSMKQRAAALRKTYLRSRNRDTLRAYLRARAYLGHYDVRMFDYYGVSSHVNDACKRAVVRAYRAGLVPTSTTGGKHAPGSYHTPVQGVGRATDFGLVPREIGTAKGARRMRRFQTDEYRLWMGGRLPRMRELIGPDNGLVVLRDTHSPLAEGSPLEQQHDNHVHEGYVT